MSQHKPAEAISRFLHGIFSFYRDKGMNVQGAKGRMYEESLTKIHNMIKDDKDIPDHAQVISAQFFSRTLQARGRALTTELESAVAAGDEHLIATLRAAIGDLHKIKVGVDDFIVNYKGVYNHGSNNEG
ncbi:hypothetical protein TCA2_4450 [Paenibacillus sp. TCA20]|uniref:Uncharacterized protein n=1 Tax=Paenibacillus urinalis TaxID=521520 RepID=A0ABY7XHG5_9BACL|nr:MULTISPECIES: hypothetical protein [Paenibacillus]WDI05213.1 hypothetical protein PUW25_25735 [Paenibacillus urinalis]GAK41958.1 hypothetical protein TCA2_4450 [Paenibacillus sp. TCA20]